VCRRLQPYTDLHQREHFPPFSIGPKLAKPVIDRSVLSDGCSIDPHVGHSAEPMAWKSGRALLMTLDRFALHPDKFLHIVPPWRSCVMLTCWLIGTAQSPRAFSLEVDRPDHPDGDIRVVASGHLRCLRLPSRVLCSSPQNGDMEMNRMVRYREIYPIEPARDTPQATAWESDAGNYAAVPGSTC